MDSDNGRQDGGGRDRGSKLTMLGRREGQWQLNGTWRASRRG